MLRIGFAIYVVVKTKSGEKTQDHYHLEMYKKSMVQLLQSDLLIPRNEGHVLSPAGRVIYGSKRGHLEGPG